MLLQITQPTITSGAGNKLQYLGSIFETIYRMLVGNDFFCTVEYKNVEELLYIHSN